MRTVGIIAEYNPLHNGHVYQLNKAKELTKSDFAVVVMSGDFVQRGFPAFMSKHTRAQMAIEAGADLVLELPVRYATASAEYFAKGAVSILNNLGCVDTLCFGSEFGSIQTLKEIAHYIYNDSEDYNLLVAQNVKKGITYPLARKHAILEHFKGTSSNILEEILSSPNNILGIEYIKAILSLDSFIEPFTVQRVCTGYHEPSIQTETQDKLIINSATAIRNQIFDNSNLEGIKSSVPKNCFSIINDELNKSFPIEPNDLSDFLFYQILNLTDAQMVNYLDLTEDFICRIRNYQNDYKDFCSFSETLKSKQYTLTRINRSLLHLILNIKQMNIKNKASEEIVPYIRVLGLNKKASFLLKPAKEREFPVITKMANAKNLLSDDGYTMLKEDIFASNLYARMVYKKYGTKLPNEFQKTPFIQ